MLEKEIGKLIRELCPLPGVPDVMQPLGPDLPRPLRNPTWEELVTSHCPPVRELKAGERPADWANDGAEESESVRLAQEAEMAAREAVRIDEEPATRRELPPITAPQQYHLQFTATEEHVQLVERAKALLARKSPGASLGELHQQAMKLLVEKLEKERFATTDRPRKCTRSEQLQQSRQRTERKSAIENRDRFRYRHCHCHRHRAGQGRRSDPGGTPSGGRTDSATTAPARQACASVSETRSLRARWRPLQLYRRTRRALSRDALPRAPPLATIWT